MPELALYGHPDSGGHWEKFSEDALIKTLGWTKVAKNSWRSVFWHEASKAFLIVYVDDFRLSGPASVVPKLFEEIGKHIKISKPEISGKFLGCDSKMFQAKYPAGGTLGNSKATKTLRSQKAKANRFAQPTASHIA